MLLASGARGPGFKSRSRHLNFKLVPGNLVDIIGYEAKFNVKVTGQKF